MDAEIKIKGKSGQVTIFIIVAIIIVVLILLILLLRGKGIVDIGERPEKNINSFLEICLKDKVSEAINLIERNGGYIDPLEQEHVSFKFSGEQESTIAYLCYYNGDYLPCIRQEPVLISHLEAEIEDYIDGEVNLCFGDLTSDLEEQGYLVGVRYRQGDFGVELSEGKAIVTINSEITLTKKDSSSRYDKPSFSVQTNLYESGIVSQKIINQEVINCNFNIVEYSQLYPEYKIEKEDTSDSSKIYTIRYEDSAEIFRLAIRGCVNPPGY